MQKLINRPADTVAESLQGIELAHPELLRVCHAPRYVYRADAGDQTKVAVVSGSGSGHEPLNTGYVGLGMLDAACPGDVFTSPTPEQYTAATLAVETGQGVLFVMKNHSGGVLNMEMAIELLSEHGITVETVMVNDDVAVDAITQRRGLGAAVLVEKIAGAAAENGSPLGTVKQVAEQVSSESRSMGVALSGCIAPNVGYPTFKLAEQEAELGVGIHGERGRERIVFSSADEVVEQLVNPIIDDLQLQQGERVLALVSGLGGTPQHELYIVYRYLHQMLSERGIQIAEQLVGNYITSLDMAGCSVTLLRVDDELLTLWDAPVRTPTLWW